MATGCPDTKTTGAIVFRLPSTNNEEETEVRHLGAGTGEEKKTLHCVPVLHPISDVTKMKMTAKGERGSVQFTDRRLWAATDCPPPSIPQ